MNKMSKRAGYEDYTDFHRLPEEIFVSIFDRVADLKYLCHCSLVSKHFATVVSRVQSVSVTVIGNEAYDVEHVKRMESFMSKLQNCTGEEARALIDSMSLDNMKFPAFFYKLTEVKCVYLDYDYSGKSEEAKIPMCKVKFGDSGTKFESFVALESSYMHKDAEDEAMEEDDIEHVSAVIKRVRESWWEFRVRFMEWICFAVVLLSCHASLRRVTLVDSEVNGKLDVGDICVLADLWKQFSGCIARFSMVPVLRLPLSGYAMRWVALTIVYRPENSCGRATKLDEIEFLEFDDELPVFREAVKEFVKKHKDKLMNILGQ